jgi:hypothetical protein
MSEWTDDMTIPLPSGRTVADLVDAVLELTLRGTTAEQIEHRLVVDFALTSDDAWLACERTNGGLMRAATRNPLNCPPQDKDPIAGESFHRGSRDPSLVARIIEPQFAPKEQ